MKPGCVLGTVLSVVLAASGITRANPAIAVESYGEARPSDANETLAPLLDELAKRGVVVGAPLVARVNEQVSRTGDVLSAAEQSQLRQLIDRGYQSFLKGNFDQSSKDLESALELARSRPATLALDQVLREDMLQAYLGLAMTYSRQGKAEASAAIMADFVSWFPDRQISRAKFGPEPADLAKRALAELAKQPRATVHVEVDDPAAVIFLDERYLAVSKAAVNDLAPGQHRIFVRGTSPGRVHIIELTAGSEKTVRLSMPLDQALQAGETTVVLRYPDVGTRLREEARGAASLADALSAPTSIVIGIRPFDGHRAIVGTVVAAGSARTLRGAAVVLEPTPPEPDAIRALGRFLAVGGKPDPALKIMSLAGEGDGSAGSSGRARSRPYRVWKYVAVGAGVVLGGLGGYWIAIDHKKACDQNLCINRYATTDPGLHRGRCGRSRARGWDRAVDQGQPRWLGAEAGTDLSRRCSADRWRCCVLVDATFLNQGSEGRR